MSQENKAPVWHINDLSLGFDVDDAGCMERYNKAFDRLNSDAKHYPKDGTRKDMIDYHCNAYYRLFDTIFGQGTAEKVFNGQMNMRLCDEAIDSFLSFATIEFAKSDQRMLSKKQKYTSKKPTDHKPKNWNKKKHYS